MLRRGAHLVQTGVFVSAKLQGRRRPQPEQVASGSWKHPSQMSGASPWARRAIRRIRPHRPHWRCGRSAQRAQTGRRSPSRPATGLMTPQRAQASASSRRRQRAQTPPVDERVSGRPTRAQTAQLGSGSDVAPSARNALTSRPTTGGAAMVNAAGSAVNAAARLRSAAGCPATAAIAASTCAADRAGSVASAAATTCRWRCSPLTDGSLSR
jgi:hypothetical protein